MALEEVMSSQDFIAQLLNGFDEALQPLEDALESPDAFAAFIAEFGWTLGTNSTINMLNSVFNSISQGLAALNQAIQALISSTGDDQLSNAIPAVVKAIQ